MCMVVYSAASDYKYAVQLLRLHPLVVVMVTLASLTQVHMRQLCTIYSYRDQKNSLEYLVGIFCLVIYSSRSLNIIYYFFSPRS